MQNFAWALGYNLLALPLGILGLVPPWIAVTGMSLSSLIVVLNALRLAGHGPVSQGVEQSERRVAYA
jgi:Cu2+-exporting ATPase